MHSVLKLFTAQFALGTVATVIAKPTPDTSPSQVDGRFWENTNGIPTFIFPDFERPVDDAATVAELKVVDTLAGERIVAGNSQLQPCYDVSYQPLLLAVHFFPALSTNFQVNSRDKRYAHLLLVFQSCPANFL